MGHRLAEQAALFYEFSLERHFDRGRTSSTVSVIRVDIAMSALSSALHNTGHYHKGPASDLRATGTAAAAPASFPRSIWRT